jgi:sigma-B regulation protein RsbU (phosphoserine phosphatase)
LVHERIGQGQAEADPDRLAQVVSNLANNAFVYGSPSTPVVVTSEITDVAIKIDVHNRGLPIPSDKRTNIFEPLSRGEQQPGKEFRSVGLGLYIVREIAVSHGGDVTLTSSEDAGTTFSVVLPRGLR